MAHARRTKDMPDNRFLHKRRQCWYVRVAVPPSIVAKLGKRHIVRSLKTRDVVDARQRRWVVIAEIKAMLADAAGYSRVDALALGVEDRRYWVSASTDPEDPSDAQSYSPRQKVEHVYYDVAEEIEQAQGLEAAETYYRIATSPSPVLREVASQWREELRGTVKEQTRSHHRSALELFEKSNPRVLLVAQVDRRVAGDFVSDVLVKSDMAPRTRNRIISSLSSLWKWMLKRGLAETNPWQGQADYSKRAKIANYKRPFNADELLKLLRGDPVALMGTRYGGAIRDLQRLGLMTGARLNELCELTDGDVSEKDRTMTIREGKTENAIRVIPVHKLVWPILEERLKAASDGQLFSELDPGGPDAKRSWYVSKRFTEYRRKLLGHSGEVDFHSLRRCFATYLERAQGISKAVHPSAIAELMGQKKQTLALSLYSGGLRLADLRKAVDALSKVVEPEVLEALRVASAREAAAA
jgi:integrase